MSDLRELLILTLALAILFSLLRAVYLIHRRRKGQIRLSIDKTIGQSEEANGIDISELPNGGARVVGLDPDAETSSALAMGDGDSDAGDTAADQDVPVLLDPVRVAPVEGEDAVRREQSPREPRRKRKKKWKEEILEASRKAEPEETDSSFEMELGAVSMTAGERIGAELPTRSRESDEQLGRGIQGVSSSRGTQGVSLESAQAESFEAPLDAVETLATEDSAKQPATGVETIEPMISESSADTGESETVPDQQAEAPRQEAESDDIETDRIIVINVLAGQGLEFAGRELWDFLQAAGLRHDKMKILSKTGGNRGDGQPIFRVANIVNPGTFEPASIDRFSTPGVSMFMLLPAPINNLLAFEQMLAVARRLAETLDGRLFDHSRKEEMTAQAIERVRQRIRGFDMRISSSSSVSSRF